MNTYLARHRVIDLRFCHKKEKEDGGGHNAEISLASKKYINKPCYHISRNTLGLILKGHNKLFLCILKVCMTEY